MHNYRTHSYLVNLFGYLFYLRLKVWKSWQIWSLRPWACAPLWTFPKPLWITLDNTSAMPKRVWATNALQLASTSLCWVSANNHTIIHNLTLEHFVCRVKGEDQCWAQQKINQDTGEVNDDESYRANFYSFWSEAYLIIKITEVLK